ncbi:MAG: hypothetical protein OXC63_04985 [Aestuariivita sp.]|nr:hypothetical protein [Aestuariivita sp.]
MAGQAVAAIEHKSLLNPVALEISQVPPNDRRIEHPRTEILQEHACFRRERTRKLFSRREI